VGLDACEQPDGSIGSSRSHEGVVKRQAQGTSLRVPGDARRNMARMRAVCPGLCVKGRPTLTAASERNSPFFEQPSASSAHRSDHACVAVIAVVMFT
jgi:hypothetical protein